jgi:hypothetical protein
MKDISTKLKDLFKKIGCDASDFSDNELNILKTLVNRDIEFPYMGRYYNYNLAGDVIFETTKPISCDGCSIQQTCSADCSEHKEYDIIMGLYNIRKRMMDIPYKIYYASPDYTILCGTNRVYATNLLTYQGFMNIKSFRDASDGCSGPGQYRITTQIDIRTNLDRVSVVKTQYSPFIQIAFKIKDTEYVGLVRRSNFRLKTIESIKATVFFELMANDYIFIPFITEDNMGVVI